VRAGVLHLRAPAGARSAAGAALLALAAAVLVILFGVAATSGVYGSRLAWLLGVALPLLAVSVVLSWEARRLWARDQGDGPSAGPNTGRKLNQVVLTAAAALFGIPFALVTMLLAAYALLFAVHGISLLV
jgi:hypothetical protein